MQQRLIVGNLKMWWREKEEIETYLRQLNASWLRTDADVEYIVCPPQVFLDYVGQGVPQSVGLGAQDVFWEESGAYTGGVSALMLRSCGVKYVIVGHSERRMLGETDEQVGWKVVSVLDAGMRVILCVGETREERDSGRTVDILKRQLSLGIAGVDKVVLENLVIAYEPRWAVGTDRTPGSLEIRDVVDVIQSNLKSYFGQGAENVRILYGGSVHQENFSMVCIEPGLDGVLVGRESLDPESFLQLGRIS